MGLRATGEIAPRRWPRSSSLAPVIPEAHMMYAVVLKRPALTSLYDKLVRILRRGDFLDRKNVFLDMHRCPPGQPTSFLMEAFACLLATFVASGRGFCLARWIRHRANRHMQERRTVCRHLAVATVAFVVTMLAACGGDDTPPPAPAPQAAAPTSVPLTTPVPRIPVDSVDVGGHSIRYACEGEGSPTVVFDATFGAPGVSWLPVQSIMPFNIRTCVYDRAGVGVSEPGPLPRNSQRIATELHTLLENAGIEPPYVLVGSFFGGLNVRMYASQYPDEVAGMVFVDGIHPDWESRILHYLTPDQKEAFIRFVNGNSEGIDIFENNSLVRETGPFGDLPIYVLSRSMPPKEYSKYYGIDLTMEVMLKLEKLWQELQADLAGLSTNSNHMNVMSDFALIDAQPEMIRDAIVQVVEQARR